MLLLKSTRPSNASLSCEYKILQHQREQDNNPPKSGALGSQPKGSVPGSAPAGSSLTDPPGPSPSSHRTLGSTARGAWTRWQRRARTLLPSASLLFLSSAALALTWPEHKPRFPTPSLPAANPAHLRECSHTLKHPRETSPLPGQVGLV